MFAKAEWKMRRENQAWEMVWKSVCLVQFVPNESLKARESGAEGVDWKWFGLEWVTSGRSWIPWSRNRHFPKPRELGLLFPARSECAAGFGCQCAWKAVPVGTKPTWNTFISIPANTLQCFSCLALASFTKSTVGCFHGPTLILTSNKGIKSAKPLLILLHDSSAVCYHLFQALVIHRALHGCLPPTTLVMLKCPGPFQVYNLNLSKWGISEYLKTN